MVQIIFIFFITVEAEKSIAQMTQSFVDQRQDTSRIDWKTRHVPEERSVPLFLFLRRNNDLDKNSDLKGSMSTVQLLKKYPELRNAALKEYIRQNVSINTNINFTQSLSIYLIGNPTLENDLKLKMKRYGVPYDPLRPTTCQFGITLYIKDVISWLKNKLR